MKMFDDFFSRALIGGFGVAIVAGPLGCFIIWRRLAYFGDTLSHSALLGVAIALLLELNITLSVFIVSVFVALMLLVLQKRASLSSDALLGLLAHSVLAIGLVVLAFMTWVRVDLMGFLFGDILAITTVDLALIWGGGAVVLAFLAKIWRALFAATVSYDLALAEGSKPDQVNLVFMVLMAILGGKGTLWGPVIGATVFHIFKEGFWTFFLGWQYVALGVLIVVIVIYFPEGIMGWLREKYPERFGEVVDEADRKAQVELK